MTLDTTETEEAILARCQSVLSRFYDTEVPDGNATPTYPYGIVYFGEPVRMATGRSMCGTRNDVLRGVVRIQVLSSTAASLRPVINKLRNALIGWTPPDSGEMKSEGGTSFTRTFTGVKPTEYVREIYVTYPTNMKGNDDVV